MNTNRELNYKLYTQKAEGFIRTDVKREFSRYDDIRNGDVEKVRQNFIEIKKHFYEGKGVLSTNPVRNNIYHLVVSAAIAARVCVDAGLPHNEAYTLSDIYIRKADVCTSPEAVIDLIESMQIDFAKRMRANKKANTVSIHVRHAIDYIYNHLHENLTLELLAKNENLNPSYFSKLFSKETGSSVKAYILEVKINTAKNILINTSYSLAEISHALGFSSQSAFTTAFKKITNTTPGKYRTHASYTDPIHFIDGH